MRRVFEAAEVLKHPAPTGFLGERHHPAIPEIERPLGKLTWLGEFRR
jgi:hypothetical protein